MGIYWMIKQYQTAYCDQVLPSTETQHFQLLIQKKGALQNEAVKMSEVWSPKGFPNLAHCFILSL